MASPKTQPVKRHFTYTIKDFYKEYKVFKKAHMLVKDMHSYKAYRGVIEDFFVGVFKMVIFENFSFMMPYSLGTIAIRAKKTYLNRAKPDIKKTKEVGSLVKHLNTHTFGYYYGFFWNKSYVRFSNNAYYVYRSTGSKKATRNGVGRKSLSRHITETSKSPDKKSYIKI